MFNYPIRICMKLIIDNIIFSWQRSGGISVVWYELIKRMLKTYRQDSPNYSSGRQLELGFVEYSNSRNNKFRRILDIPICYIKKVVPCRGMKLKRYMPQPYSCSERFIFHSTYYRLCSNSNAINVVTVHDFTYEYYNSGIRRFVHSLTKNHTLRNADYIICISENTKRDLLKFVPDIDESKIRVIYNGASDDFHMLDDQSMRYSADCEQYIVFVGSRAKYKNFELAVRTAAQAKLRLKIVGARLDNDERNFVTRCLGNNFDEMVYIDNEALNKLYNKAFALIYPSSYEGFGLPVIEAQKAGCPVLALDTSSITEIIGFKEQLAKEATPEELCQHIKHLLQPEYRQYIVQRGIENSHRYTWDRTFNEYIALYKEITDKYVKTEKQ